MAVYREALDKLVERGCASKGCDHKKHGRMHLHSSCHIDSYMEVSYEDGVVRVACGECKKPVVAAHVATLPPAGG